MLVKSRSMTIQRICEGIVQCFPCIRLKIFGSASIIYWGNAAFLAGSNVSTTTTSPLTNSLFTPLSNWNKISRYPASKYKGCSATPELDKKRAYCSQYEHEDAQFEILKWERKNNYCWAPYFSNPCLWLFRVRLSKPVLYLSCNRISVRSDRIRAYNGCRKDPSFICK